MYSEEAGGSSLSRVKCRSNNTVVPLPRTAPFRHLVPSFHNQLCAAAFTNFLCSSESCLLGYDEHRLNNQSREASTSNRPMSGTCNIPAQSPSSSSCSTSSSDMEEDLNVSMKNKTKGRQKSKSTDDKKDDRALRDIQPVELDGRVRFSAVSSFTV